MGSSGEAVVLYDGRVWVSYGFVHLVPRDRDVPELVDARGGQANGLLGAAVPGALTMQTGLHTGEVGVRMELLGAEPPVDGRWEEVVEASFEADGASYVLASFADGCIDLDTTLGGSYRARYCGSGMEQAHQGPDHDDGSPVDRYLLQLWPADPGPDRVVHQTSQIAAYWHGAWVQTQPPPPPPSAEEVEAQRTATLEAHRRQEEDDLQRHVLQSWGGRLPSARVQGLTSHEPPTLALHDRDLLDAVEGLGEDARRELARWVAETACAPLVDPYATRLRAPLEAVRRGRPLPPPFDTRRTMLDGVLGGPSQTSVSITVLSGEQAPAAPQLSPQVVATFVLEAAARPDALDAALSSVVCALWGEADPAAYLQVVWGEVTRLASG